MSDHVCLHAVSVCLNIIAFGGVGRALCLCVFDYVLMCLCPCVSDHVCLYDSQKTFCSWLLLGFVD